MTRFCFKAPMFAAAAALATGMLTVEAVTASPAMAKDWRSMSAQKKDNAFVLHIGKARSIELPREARDMLVSDPKIVDITLRTARQPVLYGMRIGQANILFFDEKNKQIRSLEVRVEFDVSVLNRIIEEQYPDARVRAESVLGQVVLDGSVRTSSEASAIRELAERFVAAARASQSEKGEVQPVNKDATGVVNRIAVLNDEQVHLKVRVAEVNRSVLKELGVDWNQGLQTTSVLASAGLSGDGIKNLFSNASSSVTLSSQSLGTYIKALEQYQLVRTLAEPSLTAVSGESASFLAGGEFPIPVAADNDTVTIEFKSFGVGLDFTPVVVGDGRISMQISTEVSDLSDNGAIQINNFTIPALSVRRANTTVELPSGGTIMMAGLIQQNTRRLSKGVPGLRQLPILGSFFRAEEHEIDETELVILVTPVAVQGGAEADFRLPTDGFAPASDLDTYLFGRLHAVYGVGEEDVEKTRKKIAEANAPVGFMME